MREWRNGRRAGFRHQFRKSEGSTPFSRTTKSGADSSKWCRFYSYNPLALQMQTPLKVIYLSGVFVSHFFLRL